MQSFKLKLEKEMQECGFLLKEFAVQSFSDKELISEFGSVKYTELTMANLLEFINKYRENWLDIFCEIFDVEYEEAKSITSMIEDENTQYLYVQKINLDYNRGKGIGNQILEIIKKDNPSSTLVLYPFPIPIRWQLGFDVSYMDEIKSKIIDFYKNNGFKYDSIKNVAILNRA